MIFEQLQQGRDRFTVPYTDLFAAITTGEVGLQEGGAEPVNPLFGNDPVFDRAQIIPMPEGGRVLPRITTKSNVRAAAPGAYGRGRLTDTVVGGWQAEPHLLVTYAEVNRAVLMQDHDGTIEALVRLGLLRGLRDGLTEMLLVGTGTNNEALGLMAHSDVHGHAYPNSGSLAEADILAAKGTLTASGVRQGNLTAVMSPSGFNYAVKTARTAPAELPLMEGNRLLGLWPADESLFLPDYLDGTNALIDVGGTMILGDFSYAAIALFGPGMEIQVSGLRNTAEVELAGLVHYDVGPLDPAAFNVITRAAS